MSNYSRALTVHIYTLFLMLFGSSVAMGLDHVAAINGLDDAAVRRGEKIYQNQCAACHGADGDKPPFPQARSFIKSPLKNGADPYSLYRTMETGLGLMPQQTHVAGQDRYDVIHYVRERFLKRSSSKQYRTVDAGYLKALPERIEKDAAADASTPDAARGQKGIEPAMGANMDYGPVMHHSVTAVGLTPRGISIRCGRDGLTALYNMEKGILVAAWVGKMLNLEATHYRKHKGNKNAGAGSKPLLDLRHSTWSAKARLMRQYRYVEHTVLEWHIGGRQCLERVRSFSHGGRRFIIRDLQITAGEAIQLSLGKGLGQSASVIGKGASLTGDDIAMSTGDVSCSIIHALDGQPCGVLFLPLTGGINGLLKGGPMRWGTVTTKGRSSKAMAGYVADELTLPYLNPWGSWMRSACVDWFSDGRLAITTLSGDVWVCSNINDSLQELRWQRICAGLYEPLGMRIVDDVIHVLGRDAIWSLHDLNGDGEIDMLEDVHSGGHVDPGYLSLRMGLDVDSKGRFYYAASGHRPTVGKPPKGCLVRAKPGSDECEIFATGFREPNGLAIGPDDRLVIGDNQGNWIPSSRIIEVEHGDFCGFAPQFFKRKLKDGYKLPFLCLPHRVDASSGGQDWAARKGFGPLSGKLLHTSYGSGRLFAVHEQRLTKGRNGFAWRFPFSFTTGVIRVRSGPQGDIAVAGLIGFDYRGKKSKHQGAVYRVRHVGQQQNMITDVAVIKNGLRISFHKPVPATAKITVSAWNYKWTKAYGSSHYSVASGKNGQDSWKVLATSREGSDRTLVCHIPDLRTCDQVRINVSLGEGRSIWKTTLWGTIRVEPNE